MTFLAKLKLKNCSLVLKPVGRIARGSGGATGNGKTVWEVRDRFHERRVRAGLGPVWTVGQGSSLGKPEDEDALDRGRGHRLKGGGGRKNRRGF